MAIDKNKALLTSQDYYFLREQGLAYIQALSGKLWTDHNLHDPGITILEILCYALTDLGYRTGFETRDLLTNQDGQLAPPETSGLFPAHQVLPTAPLTLIDYRKLLLKIQGVRNAWLDPMTDPDRPHNYQQSEIPLYADGRTGELTFTQFDQQGKENQRVRLRGLYKVLLELEIDDVLGSLNEHRLIYQVKRGALKGVVIALASKDASITDGPIDFRVDFKRVAAVQVSAASAAGAYKVRATVETTEAQAQAVLLDHLQLRVINDRPRPNQAPASITLPDLQKLLADNAPDGLMALFWKKQQVRQKSLAAAGCVLDAHRNLCEDFWRIETVAPEHVAVCARIEVKSEADIEAVQARVFHAIEQHFNPTVRYYTLGELLEEGLRPDEIFDGPPMDSGLSCGAEQIAIKPGFIKTQEVTQSGLKRQVFVSDLINILMDFEEIFSVSEVLLQKYDADGRAKGSAEKWHLPIATDHQPVLLIEKSRILFFKNEIPYQAKATEFRRTLDHLRAMSSKAAYVAPGQILEHPPGTYREPGRFFSIQHDLPENYGVGEAGLAAEADEMRVARARQLKAYLTFFDQVLADYLAQLANVGRLFSLDKDLKQTYFSQYLSKISGVRDTFENELYIDKGALKGLLQDDRNRLTESEALYQDRRNRILDHLLARFAEQFADYVLMMYSLEGDPLKTGDALIEDKIDFLKAYPSISRDRAQAFNYRPAGADAIWDSTNVSGLEKRVGRLVGIEDVTRRALSCQEVFGRFFNTRKIGNKFRLEIRNADNKILFKSRERFPNRNQALTRGRRLHPFIRHASSYQVDTSGGAGQIFYTISAGGTSLHNDTLFGTEAEAVRNVRTVMGRYDEILTTSAACDNEGFFLIEHILLRPLTPKDALMKVCLDPDHASCGDEDPYSFRITVVLPYWPERFRRSVFRRHFEHTLRQDTPAHILPRICWVSNEQMAELDRTYRAWLTVRSQKKIDPAAWTAALNELLAVLHQLETVYPAATLHDCVEDQTENPVRLGSTHLGVF